MEPEIRYKELVEKLRQQNYRLTPQRLSLVRLIATSEGHPSASQLYAKIKMEFPTMSQSTVYKTLNLLKELGEVLEIDLRGDSHYDGNRPYPHPHIICSQCGKIIDGENESFIKELVRAVEHSSGYQILRHRLVFYGFCPACQNKGEPAGTSFETKEVAGYQTGSGE